MKNLDFINIITVFCICLVVSCGDPLVDVEPPSLQFVTLSHTPQTVEVCDFPEDSVFVLMGGESLIVTANYTDETALSQYKVDIHNNFDCHGHGDNATPGFATPDIESQTEDFTILETGTLVGTQKTIVHNLAVPTNVTAGNYHFQIQVIDESGNEPTFDNIYTIKVKNPTDTIKPEIFTTQPAENFSITKGEAVQFKGTVSDNYSLSEGGNGVLYITYTDLNSGNSFISNVLIPFIENIDTSYNFDVTFTVPNTLVAGNYLFAVHAQDGVRNLASPTVFEVNVED